MAPKIHGCLMGGEKWGMGLTGTCLLHFWVVESGLVALGRHKRMC